MKDGGRNVAKLHPHPAPPLKNQLSGAVKEVLQNEDQAAPLPQLVKAYQRGGREALRKQFAKLYPGKVPSLPEDSGQD